MLGCRQDKGSVFSASTCEGTYLGVRFGNVLGSRASMLTVFQDQIERGGLLTVTDPT
jgi:FlaA1/EpsC-like NDP-sugar epimerase